MKKMILYDVGHPAHVHQFKNLYWTLKDQSWEGLFIAKEKEVTIDLLKKYKLPYEVIGRSEKGLFRKLLHLPLQIWRFYKIVRKVKPSIILSRFSVHSSIVGKLKRTTHIGFADTEHTNMLDAFTVPLVDFKITALSYTKNLGNNQFFYPGNIELFYLHPNRFSPDKEVLNLLGISANEKYAIVRFVSWNAHHDLGQAGFTNDFKSKLVSELAKRMKVFITSEKNIPENLKQYQISIPPEKIHDALAFAELYIGEGGTMASEAACLGIPSVYVNSLDAGVFHEEEKFGLLKSYRNSDGVLEKVQQMIETPEIKKRYQEKRQQFLDTQIDPTSFIHWFIINLPESAKILKKQPDYPQRF